MINRNGTLESMPIEMMINQKIIYINNKWSRSYG